MPSAPVCARTLRPRVPLDLELTLGPLARGRLDPTLALSPAAHGPRVRTALRWPEDSGDGLLVLLERAGPGPLAPVRAQAWGDPAAARSFLDRAEAWLGLEDGTEEFQASPAHALLPARLRQAARQRPGLRLARTGLLWHQLVRAVFEQRVTGSEAIGAWQSMLRNLGEPAPGGVLGTSLVVPPPPRAWQEVPSWTWREHGVDAHRARTVRAAAEHWPTLSRLDQAGDLSGLARALAGIPGIGPWTVAETLAASHGLPDALSVGDYHLAHHITWALTGARGDDEAMLGLLRPWAGNRQRVVRMLQAYGPAEPRRGPRAEPSAHRFG